MELPRFFVVKSNYNKKYLRYRHEDGEAHGFLQFSGEEDVSPYAMFEVEMARCGNGLVHLRCCYNNRYLVRWTKRHYWIVAGADEQKEDQSKWFCTLFKPVYVNGDSKTVRFLHVQLGHYACLRKDAAPYESCLFVGSEDPHKDLCDVYTIIPKHVANDVYTMIPKHVALPRFFVLKSNYSEKYLRFIHEYGEVHRFLQFSGEEVGSPYAMFEVEMAKCGNGLVHLRCCYNNKYLVRWSVRHHWIVAAADEPKEDRSKWSCTLFKPVYVYGDSKTVRFLHVQLGHYACLWRADAPYEDCLYAGSEEYDQDMCEVYTIIDCKSLLVTSKHVTDNSQRIDKSQTIDNSVIGGTTTFGGSDSHAAIGTAYDNSHKIGTIDIVKNYYRRGPLYYYLFITLNVYIIIIIMVGYFARA